MMKERLFIVLFMLAFSFSAKAQKGEGSGLSPLYSPKFKSELPAEVSENSGLFFHNGRLWTHNDSGGKPVLYALDTTTFEVVQRLTLMNV